MTGVSKHYGGVIALDNVDFACERGSIHAVLGENTSRAALYVAMTPESNSAYLYERGAEASDYSDARPDALHVPPSSSGFVSPMTSQEPGSVSGPSSKSTRRSPAPSSMSASTYA